RRHRARACTGARKRVLHRPRGAVDAARAAGRARARAPALPPARPAHRADPVRRRRALPRAVAAHPPARLRAPFPATLGPDASGLNQAGLTVAVWTRRVGFGTLRPCTGPEGT